MTVRKAGLHGLSGLNVLSPVDLEPSSEEDHVMSPAIHVEAHPFKLELVSLANVTTAVSAVISSVSSPLLMNNSEINRMHKSFEKA